MATFRWDLDRIFARQCDQQRRKAKHTSGLLPPDDPIFNGQFVTWSPKAHFASSKPVAASAGLATDEAVCTQVQNDKD